MRTTVDIDADVIECAKAMAAGRKISIGKALSDLARRGSRIPLVKRNGFYVFATDEDTRAFGPKDVETALESEDVEYGQFFHNAKG